MADDGRKHQRPCGRNPDVRATSSASYLDGGSGSKSRWEASKQLGVSARVSTSTQVNDDLKRSYFSSKVFVLVTTSPYIIFLPKSLSL